MGRRKDNLSDIHKGLDEYELTSSSNSNPTSEQNGGNGTPDLEETPNTTIDPADADTETESDLEEEEFIVEKILMKRKKPGSGGKWEYFLKWQGFGEAFNTWEPKENMDCPELLEQFEKEWAKEQAELKKGVKRRSGSLLNDPRGAKSSKINPNAVVKQERGFARGVNPVRIIAAVQHFDTGERQFLMQWEGTHEADLVSIEEAKQKCKQLVIKFFQERLAWYRPISKNTDLGLPPGVATTPLWLQKKNEGAVVSEI